MKLNMKNKDYSAKKILIIEDELLFSKRLSAFLNKLGASTSSVSLIAEAVKKLESEYFDYVLLDVQLPDGNGMELLRSNTFAGDTAVIIMTAQGSTQLAVEAMRLGAKNYLSKPFDFKELPIVFDRCATDLRHSRVKEYESNIETEVETGFFFGKELSGLKRELQNILKTDNNVKTDLPPVLIQGETGTGKTSIARWLHFNGPRAGQQFVDVNCAALPDNLAESELFGHEQGAFTDAKHSRMGLFEAADKGTLFLDEIASLSPAVQSKILMAVESRSIRRLGSNKAIPVDVRLLTASIQDLRQLSASGEFREDLCHRLDLLRINILPLRNRGEDIVSLANRLLRQMAAKYKRQDISISKKGCARLMTYPWPGNVRELSNEIERGLILEDKPALEFDNLSVPGMKELSEEHTLDFLNPLWSFPEKGFSLEDTVYRFIELALEKTGGNVSAAARLLDVPRDYIRYRLKKKI